MSHHSHHFPSTLVLLTAYCSYPTKCKISHSWPDLSNHLVLVLNLYYFTISNFHLPFTLTCYSSSPTSIPSMSYHFPSGSCLLHPAPLASQTFPVVFIICWHSTKSTSLHLFTFPSGPFFFNPGIWSRMASPVYHFWAWMVYSKHHFLLGCQCPFDYCDEPIVSATEKNCPTFSLYTWNSL